MDTILTESYCDSIPKSGRIGLLFLSFYFLLLDRCNAKGSSVPSHRMKAQGLPLGYQLPIQLGPRVKSVLG